MKMVQGSGTIADYGAYVYNCTLGQYDYKIPVESLVQVQLYAEGATSVDALQLIWTCGAGAGTIETISGTSVAGTDTNGNPYVLISELAGSTAAPCFVIALTSGGSVYFSQEYCVDTCVGNLGSVEGCYGNLDPLISYDREGIYFGENGGIVYRHTFRMRNTEVTLEAIKNDFKSGRTRNFRTESVDVFKFWGDAIPEWYLPHVDAVFKRGEVFIYDGVKDLTTKYIVDSTSYEKLDECTKAWKPTVLLRANQYQSFSCEADPCAVVVQESGGGGPTACCDPIVVNTQVTFDVDHDDIQIDFTPCEAPNYVILYRVVGSGGGYTNAGSFGGSPANFDVPAAAPGANYEGFIYADCGDGVTGDMIPWATTGDEGSTYRISLSNQCVDEHSNFLITGGTPGDSVTVRAIYNGYLQKTGGLFTRATLRLVVGASTVDVGSDCWPDTAIHPFGAGIPPETIAEITFVMTATTQGLTTTAISHNSANHGSVTVYITDINGTDPGLVAAGCAGNSATGGPSPC